MPKSKPILHYPLPGDRHLFTQKLLNWFARDQRDLPWRRNRDPYRVWVSEVMLQQTRVATVIPYYERWFEQFPTMKSLADADEHQVLKAWEGLGYYSRARNLHGAVKEVVSRYGGSVPNDPTELASLKGLGPYTVGAILSIAFNQAEPAVDGNVLRVLARLCAIEDDIGLPVTRSAMQVLARELIPPGQANGFNQALMELGATICTPLRPTCKECPVIEHCQANKNGLQAELPVKTKGKEPRPVQLAVGVLWKGDRVMIARRPSQGLLGGLWEFPGGERRPGESTERALHRLFQDRFGMELEVEATLCQVKHVFSHLIWHLTAMSCIAAKGALLPASSDSVRWVLPQELDRYPFGVAYQKVSAAISSQISGSETAKQ